MSEPVLLLGRSARELAWFRRRSVLRAAAAWIASGGFAAAWAQQRSNIVELRGDVLLNGQPLRPSDFIQTGDSVQTGPDSHLVFVIGNSSFQLRSNTRITVERGATLNTVSVLRMLSGGVASVFGRAASRQIVTPTLTAGIRGTGTYTEVLPDQAYRSYFCNCYGTIQVVAGTERYTSESVYHQSFWGEPQPRGGRLLTPAPAINHTDEELEFLAQLVDQRTAWQVLGRRGVKDGSGYMEQGVHPLRREQEQAPPPR